MKRYLDTWVAAVKAAILMTLAVFLLVGCPGTQQDTPHPLTPADTTGMRARVAQVCGIPENRLLDPVVYPDSVVWTYSGTRHATLSLVGHGIICG